MSAIDLIKHLDNIVVSDDVAKIEQLYNTVLTIKNKRLLSIPPGSYDVGKKFCRKLTLKEVLNFSDYFGLDVIQAGLVPLFDLSDGVFMAWRINELDYCLFSVVDGICFRVCQTIEDVVNKTFKV